MQGVTQECNRCDMHCPKMAVNQTKTDGKTGGNERKEKQKMQDEVVRSIELKDDLYNSDDDDEADDGKTNEMEEMDLEESIK